MQSSQPQQAEVRRPSTLPIIGIMLVIAGIFGFVNSYLILASVIIWGWLIVGLIGLATLAAGVAFFSDVDWAYEAGFNLSILNLFVGFIEMIGALNFHYAVLGWVGLGQGIGIGTIIVSAAALYFISRQEVRDYYAVW
jgi:hypothetical protein